MIIFKSNKYFPTNNHLNLRSSGVENDCNLNVILILEYYSNF